MIFRKQTERLVRVAA